MQNPTIDILLVVIGASVVFVLFAAAYLLVLVSSHKRILAANQSRLEEMTRSAERYKALFDHSLAGMIKFSVERWEIYEANDAMRRILGCSSEEEIQQCFSGLPERDKEIIRRRFQKEGILNDYEILLKRPGMKDRWILFSAKPLATDGLAYGVIIDITERKSGEEQIRKQATLLNQAQDAIIVINPQGLITYWNHGAESTYGWLYGEVTGQSLRALLYPEGKEDQFDLAFADTIGYREWIGEQANRIKDSKEIVVDSRWRKVESHDQNGWEIMIVNTDITQKKRMEAQFVKAQKMESIALLTGGIAHDLQNILSPVAMSVNLLRKEISTQTNLEVLKVVEENAQSGLELVKNILTYSKGASGERVDLDLVMLINQVLQIVSQGLTASIRLHEVEKKASCFVRGDANQLKQVFLNICINARDAMPDGGELTADIHEQEITGSDLEEYPEASAGQYLVARLSDTGVGIPEGDTDKIFEPFYTTKTESGGNGLGLAIVQGLVKSHGGFIRVRSKVRVGTTFEVFLPTSSSKRVI